MAECSIADCNRQAKYAATGWCQTHYHRYWRTGTTDLLPKQLRTDIQYRAAHGRVRQFFGSASKFRCLKCGNWANEWAYDGTDPTALTGLVNVQRQDYPVTYSVWPEFYMPMCFPCHRALDKAKWSEQRTHCSNGHELTEENTYTRPSRPNTRECRQCKDDEYIRRRLSKGKNIPSRGIFAGPDLT